MFGTCITSRTDSSSWNCLASSRQNAQRQPSGFSHVGGRELLGCFSRKTTRPPTEQGTSLPSNKKALAQRSTTPRSDDAQLILPQPVPPPFIRGPESGPPQYFESQRLPPEPDARPRTTDQSPGLTSLGQPEAQAEAQKESHSATSALTTTPSTAKSSGSRDTANYVEHLEAPANNTYSQETIKQLFAAAPVTQPQSFWGRLFTLGYLAWGLGQECRALLIGSQLVDQSGATFGTDSEVVADAHAGGLFLVSGTSWVDVFLSCLGLHRETQKGLNHCKTMLSASASHTEFTENAEKSKMTSQSKKLRRIAASGFLQYEGAATASALNADQLGRRVWNFMRDGVVLVISSILNAYNAISTLIHGAKTLTLAVAPTVLGFLGLGLGLAGALLHIAQAVQERLNARKLTQRASTALSHARELLSKDKRNCQSVDINRVKDTVHPEDSKKRAAFSKLEKTTQFPQFSQLLDTIHAQFVQTQEDALQEAKDTRKHSYVRAFYGTGAAAAAVGAVVCTALGVATGGLAFGVCGAAFAGAYFLHACYKYYKTCKEANRKAAQDQAQLQAAKEMVANKSSVQLLELYQPGNALQGNKYTVAFVLYRLLTDSSTKIEASNSHEPGITTTTNDAQHDSAVYRKILTAYLGAIGMSRSALKATKEVAQHAPTDTEEKLPYAQAFGAISDHLLGKAAYAEKATLQGRWNRLFSWWSGLSKRAA